VLCERNGLFQFLPPIWAKVGGLGDHPIADNATAAAPAGTQHCVKATGQGADTMEIERRRVGECPDGAALLIDSTAGNTTEVANPLFAGNVKRAIAATVGIGTTPESAAL
jgi:hypothetical protein